MVKNLYDVANGYYELIDVTGDGYPSRHHIRKLICEQMLRIK